MLTAEEIRQCDALLDGVEQKVGGKLTPAQRDAYKRMRAEAKQREQDARERDQLYKWRP